MKKKIEQNECSRNSETLWYLLLDLTTAQQACIHNVDVEMHAAHSGVVHTSLSLRCCIVLSHFFLLFSISSPRSATNAFCNNAETT